LEFNVPFQHKYGYIRDDGKNVQIPLPCQVVTVQCTHEIISILVTY